MSFVSAHAKKPPNYKGMTLTFGVHALIVAGVMALPGIELPEKPFTVITGTNIPVDPPKPPPPDVKPDDPEIKIPRESMVTNPTPRVPDLPIAPDITPTPFAGLDSDIAFGGSGLDEGVPITPIEDLMPEPDPVIVGASLNNRYSGQFQPKYPPAMVRMEQEGVVSVRVLVDTNGRAKRIELISSPHPEFWDSTRKHALKKWRFKPATKDGKPYEAWINLKVKFELKA